MVPALLEQKAPIDIVTDQTSAHDPLFYLPVGVSFEEWQAQRTADPARFTKAAQASMARSEEHTSELQSLMRSSYAVFCLKKKKQTTTHTSSTLTNRTPQRHSYSTTYDPTP